MCKNSSVTPIQKLSDLLFNDIIESALKLLCLIIELEKVKNR